MIKPTIAYYQAKKVFFLNSSVVHGHAVNYVANKYKVAQAQAACNALSAAIGYDIGLGWFNNANESWKAIIGARVQNGNTLTYKESDGIVLAESAKELPEASHKIRIYPNENSPVDFEKGSSHMQVRNDEGLRIHLKNMFDGNYNKWFYTAEQ